VLLGNASSLNGVDWTPLWLKELTVRGSLCYGGLGHGAPGLGAFDEAAALVSGGWESRAHFFGAASRAMRQVLVDFARRREASKRGGDEVVTYVSLGNVPEMIETELDMILTLDAALDRLGAIDPHLRQIVELRYFAGLTIPEVASLLGVTSRTIERNWLKARLFLVDEMR
jgi:RNA polymerase sigma factor (TIGR02999 family)